MRCLSPLVECKFHEYRNHIYYLLLHLQNLVECHAQFNQWCLGLKLIAIKILLLKQYRKNSFCFLQFWISQAFLFTPVKKSCFVRWVLVAAGNFYAHFRSSPSFPRFPPFALVVPLDWNAFFIPFLSLSNPLHPSWPTAAHTSQCLSQAPP